MSDVLQPASNRVDRYTVTRRLTWGNVRGGAQTTRWYASPVQLWPRDLSVIRHVAAFKQLRSDHLRAMDFAGSASRTSCDRVLRRLVHDKMLYKLGRRQPGGARGGSPQNIYTLGPAGWRMFSPLRWYAPLSVDYHALTIADTYCQALAYECAGTIEIDRVATEPESHEFVPDADMRPDLVLVFRVPERRVIMTVALEIDLATETRSKQIRDKLDRVQRAYARGKYDDFPLIVFLAPDDRRVAWLQRVIDAAGYTDDYGDPLAVVMRQDEFPGRLVL